MAFIQCSLTGTALSWYIRLKDTYKQDWHAFVQAFNKQFSSQKNAYYALIFLTIITIFLQITFIDIILPFPINFTTKHIFTQYLFPLVNKLYYDS